MSTKDDILTLLRRDSLTVAEMSARLGVTRNAVILPLKQLEATRLVDGVESKRGGVGKPAVKYRAVPGHEDVSSLAYPAFAELLVETLSEEMTPNGVSRTMQTVGRKMAARLDSDRPSGFAERLDAARAFVDSVGAATVVEQKDGVTIVRSFSCPLARAVRREPCVCSAIARFFAEVTGVAVEERCIRGDTLICQFAISDESGDESVQNPPVPR